MCIKLFQNRISLLTGMVFLFAAFLARAACAEVILDGTVGPKGSLSGPNYIITDKMGSQAGSNLFHSFETFNINTGESGTFTGPNSVQNVIGRVTGGTSSLIDGRLSCTIPGANLFLINPYGMMFGPNATLDVNGSFHASTSDYLLLGDTGRFDAVHPEQSVLTVDPPSAFGFLDDTAAPMTVNGSYLKVPEGKTLSLSGGDITLNDATLYAPGGEIDLVSVASSGEVTFGASGPGVDSFETLGDITVKRSETDHMKIDDTEIGDVDVSGEGGGIVYVRSGNFYVDGGHVFASTMGDQDSRGGIAVQFRGTAKFTNSILGAWTFGTGSGGSILLQGHNISLSQGSQVSSCAAKGSTGKPGNIDLNVTGSVTISGKNDSGYSSGLFTNTYGKGHAGNIEIDADKFLLYEEGTLSSQSRNDDQGYFPVNAGNINVTVNEIKFDNSRISTESENFGDAGELKLFGKKIELTNGTVVTASSESAGNGGDISIIAKESVSIDNSYIVSIIRDSGNGGKIRVCTPIFSLSNSGLIGTDSWGLGDAGDILIRAEELTVKGGFISSNAHDMGRAGVITLAGVNIDLIDGANLSAITSEQNHGGDAGRIRIYATKTLNISGKDNEGAPTQIMTMTFGNGNGGDIILSGNQIDIKEAIISAGTSGPGNAGDILIKGNNMTFRDGAQIGASAQQGSTGKGGDITINASGNVAIRGENSAGYPSGFFSDTDGEGDGGSISVQAGNLSIANRGTISAESTTTANAGTININSSNLLSLDNGTIKTNAANALGGDINITGKDIQLTHNSSINTSVNSGEGKGGNISIDAATLVLLEESNIMANADQGYGGDITINAEAVFLSPDSDITASSQVSGKEGKITVNSPVQDIVNAMVPLRESFLSADELLPELCETRDPEQAGSFIVDSGEGLPPRPDELLR